VRVLPPPERRILVLTTVQMRKKGTLEVDERLVKGIKQEEVAVGETRMAITVGEARIKSRNTTRSIAYSVVAMVADDTMG